MFFDLGFFGTSAPMYLDVMTLYFAILPFLLAYSIRFAIKKEYVKHYRSQMLIFITSLILVAIFEVGVRFSDGFIEFSKNSNLSFPFLTIFLAVHIFIALLSMLLWIVFIVLSYRQYKSGNDMIVFAKKHSVVAKILFIGLSVTSVTGVLIYIFLFVV